MISKTVFLQEIRSLFDVTPIEEIQMDTKFKETEEWGSMLVLSLIVMIQDEYGILITAADLEEVHTFNDLYILIISLNVKE